MLLYEFPVIVDCLIFLLMLFVLFVLTSVDFNGGFLIANCLCFTCIWCIDCLCFVSVDQAVTRGTL